MIPALTYEQWKTQTENNNRKVKIAEHITCWYSDGGNMYHVGGRYGTSTYRLRSPASAPTSLKHITLKQLKENCRTLGLRVSGTKKELSLRIVEYEEGDA